MCPEPALASVLLEAAVTAFSVLGGIVVTRSGLQAARVYWPRRVVSGLTDAINEGIAQGFPAALLPAVLAFIIVVTS